MESLSEICDRLKSEGWRISEQSVRRGLETGEDVPQPSLSSYKSVKETLLNTDLKDVVDKKMPDDAPNLSKKSSSITGPRVLQVCSSRNICVPKTAEGGDVACGRLLRLTLTDGLSNFHALEFDHCPALRSETAPGTKLLLQGKVPASCGFLLLAPKLVSLLGGRVDALYDRWRLTESLNSSSRPAASTSGDGAGPPPWIPFGKGGKGAVVNGSLRGFKAMKNVAKEAEEDDGSDAFSVQRKHAVQEIVKGSTGGKVFGGGRKMADSAVARVVAAGFPADVAQWALDNNRQDVGAAIRELRAAATGQPLPPPSTHRDSSSSGGGRSAPVASGGRAGGRGGGRGRRGRGGRGAFDDDDDGDYEAMRDAPRPSGPASLFDFFDAKLVERNETVQFAEPVSDVRGSLYEGRPRQSTVTTSDRARRGRGRGGVGSSRSSASARRESSPPPDLSNTIAWPAPGEEPPSKPKLDTSTSFLQSKARLEEQEEQQRELERITREERMRQARERAGALPPRGEARTGGGRGGGGRGRNDDGYTGRKEGSYGGKGADSFDERNNNSYRGANANTSSRQSGNAFGGRNGNSYEGRNKGGRGGREGSDAQGPRETLRDGRTSSSDGVRSETLRNDRNAGGRRGVDERRESSRDGNERTGRYNTRPASDFGKGNASQADNLSNSVGENSEQLAAKNSGVQYQKELPHTKGSTGYRQDSYNTSRSYQQYNQTENNNSYGNPSPYGGYDHYGGGGNNYGNFRGSNRGHQASYGGPQGGAYGGYGRDNSSYGEHRGAYRGRHSSSRGAHDSYSDSRDYYSNSQDFYGSRGGYGGYREQYGDGRNYKGSYGGQRGGYRESPNHAGGVSEPHELASKRGDDFTGSGRTQNRGFGGFYQGGGRQAGDGGDNSSTRYTRDQEQLIEQFKQSVQLQGYTGYAEVQEQRLPNSRGSRGALEFHRGGF